MLSYVVAVSQNNVIGYQGKVPWYLPADLEFFRKTTSTGTKTMIMGRKTFESLPRVLPDRKHIIVTLNKDYYIDEEDVEVIFDYNKLLEYAHSDLEYYVIGGAQIFELLFPQTDRLYLTRVYADFAGDTFFPEYDESEWEVKVQKEGIVDEDNRYRHTFFVLDRKK